jgi:hypothetical protein
MVGDLGLKTYRSYDGNGSVKTLTTDQGLPREFFHDFSSFFKRDFLILGSNDFERLFSNGSFYENDSQGVLDIKRMNQKFHDFLNQNGLTGSMGKYTSLILKIDECIRESNSFAFNSDTISLRSLRGEKYSNLIFLGPTDDTLTLMSNLPELEFSSSFRKVDPFTMRAFVLGHEAAHFDSNGRGGLSLDDELYSDTKSFEFLDMLQKRGYRIDPYTVGVIKDARVIAMLHVSEGSEHVSISDKDFLEKLKEKHLSYGADLKQNDLDSLSIARDGASLRKDIYGFIGAAYKVNYETMALQDPEIEQLKNNGDFRGMVRSHRPFDHNIAFFDPRRVTDQDIVLGWRISQSYPEIHYAYTKALHDSEFFKDYPETQAILKSYTESFERLHPEKIDPLLVQDVTARMKYLYPSEEEDLDVEEPEPVVERPKPAVYGPTL